MYQFQKQRKDTTYSAILLFTNQGNEYDHKEKKVVAWNNDEALSVVFLGDTDVTMYLTSFYCPTCLSCSFISMTPRRYSDEVSDVIESSGGAIVKTAREAIKFLDSNVQSHDFGFAWTITQNSSSSACQSQTTCHPFFQYVCCFVSFLLAFYF